LKDSNDALPSPLVDPLEGPSTLNYGKLGLEGRSRLPALKGVEGRARSPRIRLRRGTSIISFESTSKTNHKWVSSHLRTPLGVGTSHGHLNSLNSSRLKLGGSHHLPPYSILYSSRWRLHPNGSFSRDSQGGVPKLSRVGVLGLWELIFPGSNLRLEWSLNQSYSFPRKLSKSISHSFNSCREKVDSWLLVVGSQTACLTPEPSFAHNLGYKCSNGTCEAILGIYTSRPFHWYKKHFTLRCFDPWIWALNFWESRRTPTSHFWGVSFILTLIPKWGYDTNVIPSRRQRKRDVVWFVQVRVNDWSLVILPSPISELQHAPLPAKVLQTRKRAPTPYSFAIFSLDSHLNLSRSLGACHMVSKQWFSNGFIDHA
jgi:hypothetical protein